MPWTFIQRIAVRKRKLTIRRSTFMRHTLSYRDWLGSSNTVVAAVSAAELKRCRANRSSTSQERSSSRVIAIETRSLPTLTGSYPRRFTFYVADPLSSIRPACAAAMRADLAAIGWFRRISRNRQGLSLAVCHSRAIPKTEAAFFSAPAAMLLQPLQFQPVCSQRLEISMSMVNEREKCDQPAT